MININCAGELDRYGFKCLTGEACGLSMRLLFDVSHEGKALLARVLGLQDITLLQPWNDSEAAGSCLLTREMVPTIAIFGLLLKDKCIEAWQRYDEHHHLIGDVFGLETAEELRLALMDNLGSGKDTHWYRWRMEGTAGDRNRHEMSGRIS